jgi:DUF4097 and DUF4098 domain-containing protein YvlB
MNMNTSRLVALLLSIAATALPAQSSREREREREREIERRAERLSRTIERTVEASIDNAIKNVEQAFLYTDKHQQQGYDSRQSATRIDTTFAFSADGTVDLTSFNGDITVTGWNRKEARVKASTERGTLRWRFSSTRISVEADIYRGRTGETDYEVMVPEGVRVVLRSMNGSLTVHGVKGSVDLHTNNGDVEVTDASGTIELATLSGDATGSRLRGDVDATSLNGTVQLTDVQGAIVKAESTSGDLELVNVVSPDVDATTVSGEVDFSGPLDPKGHYNFQSHSGSVTLTIPATASARFSVETFNGEVDSDFPFTLQPSRERRQGQRLEFNVGGGEARVTAESFSGGITIRKATTQRR